MTGVRELEATGGLEPGGRRVALLLNNPFVADSRSWKLATSLSAAGWAVTVVARSQDGLPIREDRDGFLVIRLDQPRPLAWLPTPRLPDAATGDPDRPRGSPLARIRAGAIELVGRPVQALRYLRLAGQWADRIAEAVPGADIWQAEGMITLPVALALRRRLGGRVVYDARDLQVESSRFARLPGPWRRLLARRERTWARAADATITANGSYAEVLLRTLGVRATIVFNGPLAPPVQDARRPADPAVPIRARLGIPLSMRIVLYLGNVAPGRGVEQLCRAMVGVPEAMLLVVGPGGAFREGLRAEAAALPAADRIRFLPGVLPEEIPEWTAAADVAAMPIQPTTLNHRLTTPTRLFDALGAGVPVVASDLPGMAPIVRETGAGVLCDPTNPDSIAEALRTVLDAPPERRQAFHTAALAAGRGPYAWQGQVERLLALYRDLTKG
ncbi:MAG: glycosyltransferase [Chloroflexota bacterium]|nr:glycosyltransferase [Chloroflexota bacterium]